MFAAVFVTMKPGVFVQTPGHVPAEIVLIKSGILNWEHDVFRTLTGLQRGKALKDSATFILPIELEKQSRASRKLQLVCSYRVSQPVSPSKQTREPQEKIQM